MRPTEKEKTSPNSFRYNHDSECNRVINTLNSYRRFEPEVFNANRLVQPDQFRMEQRNTKHKWVSNQLFFAGR